MKKILLASFVAVFGFAVLVSVVHGQTSTPTSTPTTTTTVTVTPTPTSSATVPSGAPSTGFGH